VIANGLPFISGQLRDRLAAIGEAACVSLHAWAGVVFHLIGFLLALCDSTAAFSPS
jgi:hypothetical protein